MKFGKNLERGQVKGWEQEYVDYNKLKGFIERAEQEQGSALKTLRSEWDAAVKEEVRKVNEHFKTQSKKIEDRLEILEKTLKDDQMHDDGDKSPGHAPTKMTKQERIVYHSETFEILDNVVEFSSTNYMAFYKIFKKYDKKAGGKEEGEKKSSKLADIAKEPFHNSEHIEPFRQRWDVINDDLDHCASEHYLKKAMANDDHAVLCFWLGFICMGVLNTAVMISMEPTNPDYMEAKFMSVVPIFRFFFMLILLVWLLGLCVLTFETYKVNYIILLNIDPTCPVNSSSLFKLASIMSGVWLFILWLFISDFKFQTFTGWLPNVSVAVYPCLLLISMIILLSREASTGLPFKFKRQFLCCLLDVFVAPLRPVTFASNIVGDVLTSFTRPVTDLIYTSCYFTRLATHPSNFWRDHTHHIIANNVSTCEHVNTLGIASVILSMPYIFRFWQCIRRYCDARGTPGARNHLVNAGKYFMAIFVSAVAYADPSSIPWVAAYSIATIYAATWDIKMDWGLVYRNRTWSRIRQGHELSDSPDLLQMYPSWRYYYFTLLDLLGRSTWALTTLTAGSAGNPKFEGFITVLSAVEIFRRALWATMRVEHEHVANPSKYRTMGYVPRLALVKTPAKEVKRTSSTAGNEVEDANETSLGEVDVAVDADAEATKKGKKEKKDKDKKNKKDNKDEEETEHKEGGSAAALVLPVRCASDLSTRVSTLQEPFLHGEREVGLGGERRQLRAASLSDPPVPGNGPLISKYTGLTGGRFPIHSSLRKNSGSAEFARRVSPT